MAKLKTVHIYIDPEKYQALKVCAERDKRKLTAVINIAFDKYLKGRKI